MGADLQPGTSSQPQVMSSFASTSAGGGAQTADTSDKEEDQQQTVVVVSVFPELCWLVEHIKYLIIYPQYSEQLASSPSFID